MAKESARPQSAVQRLSAPVLLRLHRLPRWTLPLVTAALLVGGLGTPPGWVPVLFLVPLGALLVWLLSLSWALLTPIARLMRLAVVVALVLLTVGRARGQM